MHQPSCRGIVAALSRKAPRPGLGTAIFGARLLIAFALPSHVLAQEAHPAAQPATAAVLDEAPFLKENDAAMTKMMNDMAIKPSGDIDRDFVAMMVPHHQGAIDMARAELKYGRNEQLRRMSQEIIVTQQQEIAAMRLAIGDPLPPSTASPTHPDATAVPRPGAVPPMSSHDAMPHDSMNMK